MTGPAAFDLTCPLALAHRPRIGMAHGGGGRVMQGLIRDVFVAAFDGALLRQGHDGAVLQLPAGRTAMTTDSFVVRPLFFPGGDIGALAVNGTVNDLAMCGARPHSLAASFILEEGLEIETLWRVALSMRAAAAAVGVRIVTGDTKVVERGHGDGIYITTTGLGVIENAAGIAAERIEAGDAILVSRDIGRHGMAVLAAREDLAFTTRIESDCAPLWAPVSALLSAGVDVHCLRDPTRGGLSTALNELAQAAELQFDLIERAIPLAASVRGVCEVLGLDALQAACEGCFLAVVPQSDERRALEIMRAHDCQAAAIGRVSEGEAGLVTLRTPVGGRRILDMPAGEQFPRIC